MGVAEELAVGRVGDLAVEGDDVAADVAEVLERLAVGLARRDLFAGVVRGPLAAGRVEAVRLDVGGARQLHL